MNTHTSGPLSLGIDEAGRGAVLGPLVVAGVFADADTIEEMNRLGVIDSKILGSSKKKRTKRHQLGQWILHHAHAVIVEVVMAREVDDWVRTKGLNALEQECARNIIGKGPSVKQAVADGQRLFSPLTKEFPFLVAKDKADATETLVSAASIVAKTKRDDAISSIFKQYDDEYGPVLGKGYANAHTEKFLRSYYEKNQKLPLETRLSWQWRVIVDLAFQKTLF
jgi:ribonuclease HII